MADLLPTTIPSREELAVIADLARTLQPTGLIPKVLDTPGKVMAVLLRGRELGLPPMAALAALNVIDGKTSISAEAMLALIRRAGHRVEFVVSTDRVCKVRGTRGDQVQEVTYTWEQAAAFQKCEYGNWMPATETRNYKGHPAAMLRARAVSALCRMLYSDITLGLVTPDEAEEIAAAEVIDAPRSPAAEAVVMLRPLLGPATTEGEQVAELPVSTKSITCQPRALTAPVPPAAAPQIVTVLGPLTGQEIREPVIPLPEPGSADPDDYDQNGWLSPEPQEPPERPAAELRAAIRQTAARVGPGALALALSAAGVAVGGRATDGQLPDVLRWLEARLPAPVGGAR